MDVLVLGQLARSLLPSPTLGSRPSWTASGHEPYRYQHKWALRQLERVPWWFSLIEDTSILLYFYTSILLYFYTSILLPVTR